MTTPFVRCLRHNYPDAQIHYWVGKSYRAALEGNPHLSTLAAFDEQMFFRRDLRAIFRLWRQLRRERYDIAFFLGKHWAFNAFAASLLIPRRIGFVREKISRLFLTNSVRFEGLRHEVHYYLDLIKFAGTPNYADVSMEVALPSDDRARADNLMQKLKLSRFVVAINSGGNNAGESLFVRRLPREFFANLVSALSRTQSVVLLGNADDRQYYEGFTFPENVHNLAGQLDFTCSLAVMRRAARVYTTDCGGMHMAACVNEHMTAFFGPADPARLAPFFPDLEIVWPDKDQHDLRYDLYNRPPELEFFRDITYTFGDEVIANSGRAA